MSYALQSEVMSRAAELREEGLSPSSALSEAWSEVDDYGEENAIQKVADGIAGGSILLLAAVGYALWALVKKSWQPWQKTAVTQRLLAGVKPRTVYRPEIVNNTTSVIPAPGGNSHKPEDEIISFIHP